MGGEVRSQASPQATSQAIKRWAQDVPTDNVKTQQPIDPIHLGWQLIDQDTDETDNAEAPGHEQDDGTTKEPSSMLMKALLLTIVLLVVLFVFRGTSSDIEAQSTHSEPSAQHLKVQQLWTARQQRRGANVDDSKEAGDQKYWDAGPQHREL
eukprot:m.3505 g.3505  ORF g.3505 m.3505 type:complete len:152 (+) comp5679_c0_seq1:187-642(+)